MSSEQGMIIVKRSVSLSKTYLIIGSVMTFFGILFVSLTGLVSNAAATAGATAGVNATAAVSTAQAVPYVGMSFQALAAAMFATPVLLLFVYDKNNGVLEYLMSLGMNQQDIFRQYLKAALILGSAVAAFDAVIDVVIGLIEGTAGQTLEIAGLVVAVALAAVSFSTTLMMSFSSLQKQRMGANQPLGYGIGAFVIIPSYLLPLALPAIAFWIDLLLAAVIVGLALLTFSLSGRLISREKLLP